MKFWIDIQASDGTKYGDGPIITALEWETTARLDRAGRFSFVMPAADPKAALVQNKREAWCYGIIDGAITMLGAGIIDQVKVAPDEPTMLSVAGDDLLRELTYRSVGQLEIEDAGGSSATALDDILAEAPAGWSLDEVNGYGATGSEVYASFAGQTVLSALNKVGEHIGEHFRLGDGKKVVWLQDDISDCGFRAIQGGDPIAIEDNDDVCLITRLEEVEESYDLVTRLFGFGAGQAEARVNLGDASISAPAGYVLDTSNDKGANLTHSAAFATYGQIERFLSWKEISPISNTEADIESAGNALLGAVHQYMERYSDIQRSYRLEITKLVGMVYPGQSMRVIYNEWVNGYHVIDIDDDLTILETTTLIDGNGVRTVALQVSTVDAWPPTWAEVVSDQLEEARLMDGHPQTFAGYYSEGLGNFNVSPTYSAIARFKFDNRITRLVSAVLRFRSDAFEVTATGASSGGGSTPTSSSGGGTTRTSDSDAHTHGLQVVNLGTSGAPVYFTPSVLFCNGVSGTIFSQSDSHNHDTTIPNHSHSVTVSPHSHSLSYGISRSGQYPGGITIWVNGVDKTFDLTGEVSLGTSTGSTGVIEVELADILNDSLRQEHTIELKCSSGQGRILNVALRCFVIVQAIFVTPVAGSSPSTPDEPTVNVAATADGWRLSWVAVSGAESYRVYKNTVADDGGAVEITITTSTGLDVAYGGGYIYFAATAIAGSEESDIGPWATDASTPDPPVWVNHTYVQDGHLVEWYHPDQAVIDEFVIYRNTSGVDAGATEVITVAGTATSYVIPFGTDGDYFGVKAVSYAANESSIVWTAQEYDPTPDTPASPTVQMVELGGFVMSWQASAGALRYEVQGAEDGSGTNAADLWAGDALYTPTFNTPDVTYFRVRAIGIDESESDWSAWLTDTNSPPTPGGFSADNGYNQVSLDVDLSVDTSYSSTGFRHWEVQQADDDSGTNSEDLAPMLASNLPRAIPLQAGSGAYYRIRAVDWAGNASDWTSWDLALSLSENTWQDKFDTYGGTEISPLEALYWLQIDDLETLWTGADSLDGTFVKQGAYSNKKSVSVTTADYLIEAAITQTYSPYLDLSTDGRLDAGDFVCGWFYVDPQLWADNPSMDIGYVEVRLIDSSGTKFAYIRQNMGNVGGWHHLGQSSYTDVSPGFDWTEVEQIKVTAFGQYASGNFTTNATYDFYFDEVRFVKADPDDAGAYNDTGRAWDFGHADASQGDGIWHVLPGNVDGEPDQPYCLMQGDLISGGTDDDWMYLAERAGNFENGTIQCGIYALDDGVVGLLFFIADSDPGSWDAYGVELDTSTDTVSLVKWVAGVRSVLDTGTFSVATGQHFWLGVDFRDFGVDDGRLKVFASTIEGNLIQSANMVISIQDTSLSAGGSVGILSRATARFFNFRAGSPQHTPFADVAEVALGLAYSETGRLLLRDNGGLEYSTDGGETWTPVDSVITAQAFHAYLSSDQSINTGTWTTLLNWTESFDTDSWFTPGTGKLQPDKAVKMYVYAQAYLKQLNSEDQGFIRIFKNGSDFISTGYNRNHDVNSRAIFVKTSGPVEFNGSTDYITIDIFHDYGSARDVDGTSGNVYTVAGAFVV